MSKSSERELKSKAGLFEKVVGLEKFAKLVELCFEIGEGIYDGFLNAVVETVGLLLAPCSRSSSASLLCSMRSNRSSSICLRLTPRSPILVDCG